MQSMTSRQRLLAAMRRQPVDRVPVTLYEFHPFGDCWAAEEPSYRPLLDLQDRYGDAFVRGDCGGGLLGDPNAVRTHSELAGANEEIIETVIDTPKGPLRSVQRKDRRIATTWTLKSLLETDEDIERFLSIEYRFRPPDLAAMKALEARMGQRGVLLFSMGDPLGHLAGNFDFEEFVVRCCQDLGPIRAMLDKIARMSMDQVDFVNAHFRNAALRLWGPEYAGAPLMDPRRFFGPLVVDYDRPLVDRIHAGGNLAVCHCHGRLNDLLEPILEIGCDVLEPLEVLPCVTADVTMADIRRRVGDRVCLAGGMQAVDLDTGTTALVAERVKAVLAGAGPRGFILLPTSTPLEIPLPPAILANYREMFETAACADVG